MDETKQLMQLLEKYLDGKGVKHDLTDGTEIIELAHRGPNGPCAVRIAAQQPPLTVFVIVELPLIVKEEKRIGMAEAVARANFGLALGRFDLNMSNGAMSLQAAIPLADSTLTFDQFILTLISALRLCDRYLRAFARLLYADDMSPAEAIAEVEMGK